MFGKIKVDVVITECRRSSFGGIPLGPIQYWKFAMFGDTAHNRIGVKVYGGPYNSKASCEKGMCRIAKRMNLKIRKCEYRKDIQGVTLGIKVT